MGNLPQRRAGSFPAVAERTADRLALESPANREDNAAVKENVCLHVDLDGAWAGVPLGVPTLDRRAWGPRLRFSAPDGEMKGFLADSLAGLGAARFLVYGSGDFHHLSALWMQRVERPVTLVSFDNHPDWDIRPPKWCCGSWMNRALDLPQVEHISVWGCGNFECWGWHRVWGNHGDVRRGRLAVHPWADERSAEERGRATSILAGNWRDRFAGFAAGLDGKNIYVTVDLDGLRAEDAVTNWENGRFTAEDVAWAVGEVQRHGSIVAGDLCGARSDAAYARWTQRFASETDHPDLPPFDREEAGRINGRSFRTIWPVLTGL